MSSKSKVSVATTDGSGGRNTHAASAAMLDEYLASPPTVTETLACGKTTKNKKKKVQRNLKKWQKDWDSIGASRKGK